MSVTQMTLAFQHSKSRGVPRLVLLALADEASDEGEVTAYRRSQTWLARKAGTDARGVRRSIENLAELGELTVIAVGDGRKSSDYQLHIKGGHHDLPEGGQDGRPREVTTPAPSSQSSPVTPESSSLRSEGLNAKDSKRAIATQFWDWHLTETGGPPAQDFKALMAVANACLKRGYDEGEIVDAMKLERRALTAAKVIDRIGRVRRENEDRPATSAIPGPVVKAMMQAKPWFEKRWVDLSQREWAQLCEIVAANVRRGYGIGETLIRLAIASRDRSGMDGAFWLMNIDVPRFAGELADVPGSMETAYKNRGWRVS